MPQMRDFSPEQLGKDFEWFCETKPADFFGGNIAPKIFPKSNIVLRASDPEKGIFFTSTQDRVGINRTYWMPNPLNKLFVPSSRLSTANNNPGFTVEYLGEGAELELTTFDARRTKGFGVGTQERDYALWNDEFDSHRKDSYHSVYFLTKAGSVQYEYWFNDGSYKELRMYFRHDSRTQDFASNSIRARQLELGELRPGLEHIMQPRKTRHTVMRWDIEEGQIKAQCHDKDSLLIETEGPLVFDYKKILSEIIDPRIVEDPASAPLGVDHSWVDFRRELLNTFGFSAYAKDIIKEKELEKAIKEMQKERNRDYEDLPPLV